MKSQSSLQDSPPPIRQISSIEWLKQNLFSSWFNSILTVICVWLIYSIVSNFASWAFTQADWSVLSANLRLFMVGRYPTSQYWRIWLTLALISLLGGVSWGIWDRFDRSVSIVLSAISISLSILLPVDIGSRLSIVASGAAMFIGFWLGSRSKSLGSWLVLAWLLAFPVGLWLIGGGLGLPSVEINLWNGLLLTTLLAVSSIFLSFPLGVMLALGRQSKMPVIKWFSTIYIEVVRGLPLIGILFIAQVMLPLMLPTNLRIERLIRAIAGFVLFASAYLAENVRGGLQAIPVGQTEAAKALGLNTPLTLGLIILPQALRAVIPSIAGQFISLFKDTALVSVVGLVEIMGVARSVLAQPDFIGRYAEVYCFVGAIYWVCSYSMSLISRRIEKSLDLDK